MAISSSLEYVASYDRLSIDGEKGEFYVRRFTNVPLDKAVREITNGSSEFGYRNIAVTLSNKQVQRTLNSSYDLNALTKHCYDTSLNLAQAQQELYRQKGDIERMYQYRPQFALATHHRISS